MQSSSFVSVIFSNVGITKTLHRLSVRAIFPCVFKLWSLLCTCHCDYTQDWALTLNTPNYSNVIKDTFSFWIISWIWLDPSRWIELWNKNACCLSYTPNNMFANALVTLGAKASEGMVLSRNIQSYRQLSSVLSSPCRYEKRIIPYSTQWIRCHGNVRTIRSSQKPTRNRHPWCRHGDNLSVYLLTPLTIWSRIICLTCAVGLAWKLVRVTRGIVLTRVGPVTLVL